MSQVEAADILNISDRHIRNLVGKVKERGAKGMAHGNRGKESPRKMPGEREERIAEIIRARYWDFKPTLASEKLEEREGIKVSREKLRQIMMAKGLWRVRHRKKEVHPWRERKHFRGEMVQMDGSHHDWLERRGPMLVLMGYIDDATNTVFGRFYDHEGVWPAMDSLERYVQLYGLPRNLYLDKHSTYKTSRHPDLDELLRGEEAQTQFERAAKEMGIDVLHANSPQAKGRIERNFGTLQDRLVKEMRLAGVGTMEEANRFLDDYWPEHNRRFSRPALGAGDLHRPLPKNLNLRDILCLKGSRTINNGSLVRWKGRLLAIENPSLGMRRRQALILEHFDGRLIIRFNGRDLKYREVQDAKPESRLLGAEKKIQEKKKGKSIPPVNHPWRKWEPHLHHNWYLERI